MGFVDILRMRGGLWEVMVIHLPGPVGDRLRLAHWRRRLAHVGERVKISQGAHFTGPGHIRLDDGCWIDRNVLILAGPPSKARLTKTKENAAFPLKAGEVYIGKATHIAPNCVLSGHGGIYIGARGGVASNSTIYSFSHHYRNLVDPSDPRQYSFTPQAKLEEQAMLLAPVYVEDDCAVGLNSTLLPGTWLKRGTWVASGTVVKGTHGPQVTVAVKAETTDTPIEGLKFPD